MKYSVLLHRVAVQPFKFEEWDEGRKKLKELGLELPTLDSNIRGQASVDIGVVLQIGSTAFKAFLGEGEEIPVKVNDVVSYVRNAGKAVKDPFKNDGEEIVVLNDEDLIAVLSKDE